MDVFYRSQEGGVRIPALFVPVKQTVDLAILTREGLEVLFRSVEDPLLPDPLLPGLVIIVVKVVPEASVGQ